MGLSFVAPCRQGLLSVPLDFVKETFGQIFQELDALANVKFDLERNMQDFRTRSPGQRRDLSELTGNPHVFKWIHTKFSELLFKVSLEVSPARVLRSNDSSSSFSPICHISIINSLSLGLSKQNFELLVFNVLCGKDFCIHGEDPSRIQDYFDSLMYLWPEEIIKPKTDAKHPCCASLNFQINFEGLKFYLEADLAESQLARQVRL